MPDEEFRTFAFTGKIPGPRLLITGAVHGDEFEPIVTIRKLITLFEQNTKEISGFCGRVTLVPVVNQSAFDLGKRCGEDGLDLARICPGNPNGNLSQRTAWRLSQLIRESDFYIDLHTGGTEFAIAPLVGYLMHVDQNVLAAQRRMANAFGLGIIWGTASNLEGRSLSVARDAFVPAIYAEYFGSATCQLSGVEAYFQGCLNVMTEIGILNRPMREHATSMIVEDPTPDSGHLQVCNPAPISGLFIPTVELGSPIQSGSLLGIINPLDGRQLVEIRTQETGIVIMVRTFPRVRQGESVGVVLSTK